MTEQTTLAVFNRLALDQKTSAQRRWRESARPDVAQRPCDLGLFSDDSMQTDLFPSQTRTK
jgi:hypothetical protein